MRVSGVERIAWADGDLRWVFHDLEDPGDIPANLTQAERLVRDMAGRLGVRAGLRGASGCGLEFERVDGLTMPSLEGVVQVGEIWFRASVFHPMGCAWGDPKGPPWTARAAIELIHPDDADCDFHVMEEAGGDEFASPYTAVREFLGLVQWLHGRSVAEPVESWPGKIRFEEEAEEYGADRVQCPYWRP